LVGAHAVFLGFNADIIWGSGSCLSEGFEDWPEYESDVFDSGTAFFEVDDVVEILSDGLVQIINENGVQEENSHSVLTERSNDCLGVS
jgi:hypothetical protein